MGRRDYSPYLDKRQMRKEIERKNKVLEKPKDYSYMTPKQKSDLEYTAEEGTLGENIPIIKVNKKTIGDSVQSQKGAGMTFYDPLGFKKKV